MKITKASILSGLILVAGVLAIAQTLPVNGHTPGASGNWTHVVPTEGATSFEITVVDDDGWDWFDEPDTLWEFAGPINGQKYLRFNMQWSCLEDEVRGPDGGSGESEAECEATITLRNGSRVVATYRAKFALVCP